MQLRRVPVLDVFDSPDHNFNSLAMKRIGWPDLCDSKPFAKFKEIQKEMWLVG